MMIQAYLKARLGLKQTERKKELVKIFKNNRLSINVKTNIKTISNKFYNPVTKVMDATAGKRKCSLDSKYLTPNIIYEFLTTQIMSIKGIQVQLKLHLRKEIATTRESLNIKVYEVYQTFKIYLEFEE